MARELAQTSYEWTRNRFDKPRAAARYASRFRGTARDAREQCCILAALRGLPAGSRVVDLPCGTGRLTPMLVNQGFRVIGADSSKHMIATARSLWLAANRTSLEQQAMVGFEVQDILGTTYKNREFEAVVCNRLFHHFLEPQTRLRALAELRRISAGPIVVSFFNSLCLGAVRLQALRRLFRRVQRDRSLISPTQFGMEGLIVGLYLERILHTRWGVSPQCYAVFRAIDPC